ncbi:MAG: hypothetical protein ACRD1T_19815 [Acidimicrobiia bacterium]
MARNKAESPNGPAAIQAVIEQLVEDVDPRIRLIRGYRKKLHPGVEVALKHARDIVARIPGPFALDTENWRKEPLVNVAFARADELPAAVSRSVEVRDFFERGAGKLSSECFALFGMRREERRIFGKELIGDLIHSDVVQTTVSFTDHRLIAPATTMDELRLAIERRAFHHLVEEAIDQVARALERKKGLEEQRAVLRLKLKLMARQRQGLQGLLEAEPHTDQKAEDLQKELAEVEARFRKLQTTLTNLENYVPHLNKVLGHPEQYLSLQDVRLRLNRMNILVTGRTEEPVHELSLTEATLRDGRRFVLLLVKCARDQLRSQKMLFEEAARRL